MSRSFNSVTQVSLPNDTEILVTRDFRAPRELLWQAHVDPQLFRRWIGGYPGWSMPVCELDVRPGGAFRWRWRQDAEEKEFGFHGEYIEVDRPSALVSVERFDPGTFGGEMPTSETTNHTSFAEQDGITTLTVRIVYASKAARNGALSSGMTEGMETSYARLTQLVADDTAALTD